MLDWATLAMAGTFAWGLIQSSGGHVLETVRDGVIESQGDNYFCGIVKSIAEKLKTSSPPENHELTKAFRRACIVSIKHICSRRRTTLGDRDFYSLISKPKNLLLGATPTTMFGHDEKEWLDKADSYLQNEIDKLNNNKVWFPKQSSTEFQMLINPKGISNIERANEFCLTLLNDTITELTKEVGEIPALFVREMEASWFSLVCNEFQTAISNNELLANKFQNQTLVEIKTDTNEIKFTLAEVLTLLREVAGKKNEVAKKVVFNLPNLNEKVYDREIETREVLRVLFESDKQFSLVVAPSGFGKTFLLTKILQNITDGKAIKPEYKEKVQFIIRIDCRLKQTLREIVSDFEDVLGVSLEYPQDENQKVKEWLSKYLFPVLMQAGTILLILENFEYWLDKTKGYKVKEREVRSFLNALFESNHTLRLLIFSLAEPNADLTTNLHKLETVSNGISDGLPEINALDFLKIEGKSVGLDKVEERLLKEFLRRVCRIPQAMSSLVGFMKTKQTEWRLRRYNFADFIADGNLWAKFDEYEQQPLPADTDEQNKAMRRTKSLIAQQLEAQSDEIKLLTAAIAFFAQPVPLEALEILCEKLGFSFESISRLIDHRLATATISARGIMRFDLQPYFLEQARNPKIFSLFESLDVAILKRYAEELSNKGIQELDNPHRAIDILQCVVMISQHLVSKNAGDDVEKNLAAVYINKSLALQSSGKLWDAVAEIDKAFIVFERVPDDEKLEDLAGAFINKGNFFDLLGKRVEAIEQYDTGIAIFELLVDKQIATSQPKNLGMAYMNKGIALNELGEFADAIKVYEKAVTNYKQFVNEENSYELAIIYMNKGVALARLGKAPESITEFDKALSIYELLVKSVNHNSLKNSLARTYSAKGLSLKNSKLYVDAISEVNKAIAIWEALINEENHYEMTKDLAVVYFNKGVILEEMLEYDNAIKIFKKSICLLFKCLEEYSWVYVLPLLMRAIFHQFGILFNLERWSEAGEVVAMVLNLKDEYFESIELSKPFYAESMYFFDNIIWLICRTPEANRQLIYKGAGPNKELLKDYVNAIEVMSKTH